MLRVTLIGSLFTVLVSGPATAQQGKEEYKRLHGTWRMTSGEGDVGDAKKFEIRFAGDKITYWVDGKVALEGILEVVEPTKHAKRAKWNWDGGLTDRVIYFMVGDDTLVTCWTHEGTEWPTVFATGNKDGGSLALRLEAREIMPRTVGTSVLEWWRTRMGKTGRENGGERGGGTGTFWNKIPNQPLQQTGPLQVQGSCRSLRGPAASLCVRQQTQNLPSRGDCDGSSFLAGCCRLGNGALPGAASMHKARRPKPMTK